MVEYEPGLWRLARDGLPITGFHFLCVTGERKRLRSWFVGHDSPSEFWFPHSRALAFELNNLGVIDE
jgi:hypothetical protein